MGVNNHTSPTHAYPRTPAVEIPHAKPRSLLRVAVAGGGDAAAAATATDDDDSTQSTDPSLRKRRRLAQQTRSAQRAESDTVHRMKRCRVTLSGATLTRELPPGMLTQSPSPLPDGGDGEGGGAESARPPKPGVRFSGFRKVKYFSSRRVL